MQRTSSCAVGTAASSIPLPWWTGPQHGSLRTVQRRHRLLHDGGVPGSLEKQERRPPYQSPRRWRIQLGTQGRVIPFYRPTSVFFTIIVLHRSYGTVRQRHAMDAPEITEGRVLPFYRPTSVFFPSSYSPLGTVRQRHAMDAPGNNLGYNASVLRNTSEGRVTQILS
jgi:hypothetical protein